MRLTKHFQPVTFRTVVPLHSLTSSGGAGDVKRTVSCSSLPTASLSMASVTRGQPRPENVKCKNSRNKQLTSQMAQRSEQRDKNLALFVLRSVIKPRAARSSEVAR